MIDFKNRMFISLKKKKEEDVYEESRLRKKKRDIRSPMYIIF